MTSIHLLSDKAMCGVVKVINCNRVFGTTKTIFLSIAAVLLSPQAGAQAEPVSQVWNGDRGHSYATAKPSINRSAIPTSQGMVNALEYGANPNDSAGDSSIAINNAASATIRGRVQNVYLPTGEYHISNPIRIGSATQSQCLVGDGWGTIVHVSTDFNPKAVGVIVINGRNPSNVRACVRGVHIVFDQPSDFRTTAVAPSAGGASTVAVASSDLIRVGDLLTDLTDTTAIGNIHNDESGTNATVVGIDGNTVTISKNSVKHAGVRAGDLLAFSPPRAAFTSLSVGCSLSPGSAGCRYPWAIYTQEQGQNQDFDDIVIEGAWDGLYERGQTFHIGKLSIGAFDIGLDIDDCHNFPQLEDYEFWNFGQGVARPQDALYLNFYDGATVAANIGATDGIYVGSIQSWTGIVNLTASWSWGHISSLMLDGSNANLNISPTSKVGGFVLISNMYSTKSSQSQGTPIAVNAGSSEFAVEIGSLQLVTPNAYSSAITLSSGILDIKGGNIWDGLQSTRAVILQTGGELRMSNVRLAASPSESNSTYIKQTGGVVHLGPNVTFPTPPNRGNLGLVTTSANPMNSISGVFWNDWGTSGSISGGDGGAITGSPSGLRIPLTIAGSNIPADAALVRFTQTVSVASSTVTLPTGVSDGQPIQFVNYAGPVMEFAFSPPVRGWKNGSALGAMTGIRIRWDAAEAAWYREQ
jgi:hypothetical protein